MTSSAIDTSADAELRDPVAFLDSGIGGLPYLDLFRLRMPGQDCIFFADTENYPYGLKSENQLHSILEKAVDGIIARFHPPLIVIACNTASVTGLHYLRSRFDIPFVGVVPAVKPAAENSKINRIGVLATAKTIKTEYLDQLITDYASDCVVERYGDPDIVDIVEYGERLGEAKRKRVINDIGRYFSNHPVDHLILACTHFVYLRDELRQVMGDGVEIIDSVEGVVRQTIKVLKILGTSRGSGSSGKRHEGKAWFFSSAGPADKTRLENMALRFRLEYKGRL